MKHACAQTLEAAIAEAQRQAQKLDAAALGRAQHHLHGCFAATAAHALSGQQWAQVAGKLQHYRDTLRLMHTALQRAIDAASRLDGVGYQRAGRAVARGLPFMKRYG